MEAGAGVVYLLPPLTAIAPFEDFPTLDVPTVWATVVQVDVSLTALLGLVIAITLVVRRTIIANAVIVRLLVIPFVAIHAAANLPAILNEPLAKPIVALGVVAAVLVFLPPVAADPLRHGRTVLSV